VLTNAIAAAALTLAATWGGPAGAPLEDAFLEDLAAARDAGKTIFEDYTWKGMPDAYADDDLRADAIQGTEYDNIASQVAALHQGCWIEYKADQTSELLYGDLALMPAGATEVPCGQVDEALEYGQEPPAGAEDYYGGTPGGAVCSTDAACSAYTRDKGGEYGYGTSPEKAALWDGLYA
jgi:hypothetical protein